MNKRMLIGLVVLILLGGGAAAYFATKGDDNETTTPTSSQTNNPSSANPAFDAASTEDLEFKATISTTNGSQTTESTIEHDDKGSTRYVASAGGQQTEIIYTSDAYYTCSGDNCIKYPLSQTSSTSFNPADYQYDATKLAGYKSGAAYKAKQSCPSGTCDVWSVSGSGGTTTLYVDSDTKRITQVETTISGATSKIVYEYKDVSIKVPTNAQAVPTQ